MSEAVEIPNTETEKSKAEPFEKLENKHAPAQVVGNVQIKNPNVEPAKTHVTEKKDEEEFWPLSGKPYFHVIMMKSHVKLRYNMYIPKKVHQLLPSTEIPVVLKYCGKTWNMVYLGSKVQPQFDSSWKHFVADNDLKIGDGCVFELAECLSTKLVFKVQILRGDFPDELLANARGRTSDKPIIVD